MSDLQDTRWHLLALVGVVLTVLAAIDATLVALWYYTRIEVAIAVGVPLLAWAAAALRRRTRQMAMIGVYVQVLLVLCLIPAIGAGWFGGIGYVPRAVAVWLGAEIALTVLGWWYLTTPNRDRRVRSLLAAGVVGVLVVTSGTYGYWVWAHYRERAEVEARRFPPPDPQEPVWWLFEPNQQEVTTDLYEDMQGDGGEPAKIWREYTCPSFRAELRRFMAPYHEKGALITIDRLGEPSRPTSAGAGRHARTVSGTIRAEDDYSHEAMGGPWRWTFTVERNVSADNRIGWCLAGIDTHGTGP